jgi:translation initiation factor 2D
MFKKKPQIKNLSPLRSSDRRKLADQIISEFDVQIPGGGLDLEGGTASLTISAPDAPPSSATNSQPIPTLSSIRNSLVPEDCSSARFTTHVGADNKLVSGTIYIGSHPDHEERILWLQWGANTQRLYPTVYTLWANPGLVLLVLTPGLVMDKLVTGADLMTPGLAGGPPWPAGATKDSLVAVAKLECPSVPIWIGICEFDISTLGTVHGLKGKAVNGVHWAGDEIWAWTSSVNSSREHHLNGGRNPPEAIRGWESIRLLATAGNDSLVTPWCGFTSRDPDRDPLEAAKSIKKADMFSIDISLQRMFDSNELQRLRQDFDKTATQEIDDAFEQAFLYSLYSAKSTGSPPYYGLDLPGIQPSYMVAKMIQPYLKSQDHLYYNIKKTSWKNTKKFIKHLDKQGLVKAKDRNGGETIILDIDFEDARIKQFVPYKLPEPKINENAKQTDTAKASTGISPSSQSVNLHYLFRVSSKLVPELIPSKTEYYTRAQISDYIRTYIGNNADLSEGASSKRYIKLNPFIANNVLASNQTTSDTQILASGEIARDALQKRVLDDDHLCVPFWILLGSDQSWDPSDRSLPKPKAGAPPKVTITIEKRTGTKTVTTVTGLENFNVSPQIMAPELQKKCASSASVQQASGLKPGMMEIMVQGDQRDAVIKEAGRRGVKREWFEVVDKTKKKGR